MKTPNENTETPPPAELVEPLSDEAALESMAAAFQPESSEPPADMPREDTPALKGGVEKGTAWGGDPIKKEASEEPPPKEDSEPIDISKYSKEELQAIYKAASATPEGKELFPEQPEQAKSWDDLRGRFNDLKKENEELKNQGPAKLTEELEAIAKIRSGSAYAEEVMKPQLDALNEAKVIAGHAYIDETIIEALFEADNKYDAQKLLTNLHDVDAEKQLAPLVMQALASREKGLAALKSESPVEELKKWQARSQQIDAEKQQMMSAEDSQMDKAAMVNVFDNEISKTPLGQTAIGQQKYQEIIQEIDNGTPVTNEELQKAIWYGKMAPLNEQLITRQAADLIEQQQINAQLRADLEKVGVRPSNAGATETGPTVNRPGAGNRPLPKGKAWG